ncbi:MAG: hypothetical protein COA58_13560 [Bacteroidetes bacterium]|nr:MAG: hypothetical protein COA58_13560 [Bacteroidota bacterium]
MKKIILSLTLLFIALFTLGQAPNAFNYQAAVRDASGDVLANQNVRFRISIRESSINGTSVYTETHSATTNEYGLINLAIGNGAIVSGSFNAISWGSKAYFLKTEMDASGGTSYIEMSTQQLMSVPYALSAKTAENVTNDQVDDADADATNELQTLSLSGTSLTLSDGGGSVTLPSGGADADADPTNEIQTLSLSGTSLTLSDGGGSVTLPSGSADADADPTNEIQTISKTGNIVTLSNSGGTFTVDDADANATNEIQIMSKSGTLVSLSSGGGSFTDAVDDADADATNEIQTISKSGSTVTLSNSGGTFTDEVNDQDADTTNEIQTISKTGNTISLSKSGGSITLSSDTTAFIYDTDRDTRITTELTSDDDIIRFYQGGTEYLQMEDGRMSVVNTNDNILIGENAGISHTASERGSIFIGQDAGRSNTSGNLSVAIGDSALRSNTTAVGNVAIGRQALFSNITSIGNTAVGYQSLLNTTGSGNTGVGVLAASANTSGINNTFYGMQAGFAYTTGNYNVINGYQGGWTVSGSSNTYIGAQVGPTTSYDNVVALGSGATPTASNQVRFGNASTTSIGGNQNWTNTSDARFKNNVKENVVGLDFILTLRPVTYNLDHNKIAAFTGEDKKLSEEAEYMKKQRTENSKKVQTGFIAQEVEEAAKKLHFDFSGIDAPKNDKDHYGLRYAEFVVPLVKGMQEQQELIQAQQTQLDSQEAVILEMQKQLAALKALITTQAE